LTDKLLECPGPGIVRQYKNDGKEEDNLPKHLLITERLVGVKETAHTVLDAKNVVVHGVNVIGVHSGVADDTSRIEAREVEGTGGLKLTGVEAEGVGEKLGTWGGVTMGGVVVERDGGEVGVGELEVGNVGTVNLKLDLVRIRADVHSGGISSGEVFHWMIEIELLNLVTRRNRLLDLGDNHILGRAGEHLTLLSIEVSVVGVDLPLVGGGTRTPSDAELDIVVLEGDEGESSLPVLTESEAEGVETLVGGTTVEVTGDRLGGGSGREGGGNLGRVEGILLINHLTTDEELHLGDGGGPVGDDVGLGTIRLDGHEVDVVEHVTLALEADGGHTVVRDVALNDLTLDSLGEVRVTLVGRTEKADFGLTDEVHILSTDGNELGDTTRHFIL